MVAVVWRQHVNCRLNRAVPPNNDVQFSVQMYFHRKQCRCCLLSAKMMGKEGGLGALGGGVCVCRGVLVMFSAVSPKRHHTH